MYNIKTHCLGKAHELLIEKIIKDGDYLLTEDGEKTVELNEPLNVHLSYPFNNYMISPCNIFGERAMQQYVNDLLNGSENEFAYTYHDRLFCYDPTNQIKYIIEKLQEEPNSRRALAITWKPSVDTRSSTPPCLQRIQCFIRNNKLNFYCEFRSNDMLSAWGANAYALVHLQKEIAEALNVKLGWYSHTSVSAHIYYERDRHELEKYLEIIDPKKTYSKKLFN